MASDQLQWGRKATLLLLTGPLQGNNPSAYLPGGDKGLDLSQMHFRFQTAQQDVESPNNCTIRVYNLSQDVVKQIRGEYSRVILQAGYESSFGVIFDGTIRQFKIGRENATDTYLDILAADGDLGYNFGFVNQTLAAGQASAKAQYDVAMAAMGKYGLTPSTNLPFTGGILPRGKVLFGMARNVMRDLSASQGVTWSIQNGQVVVTPLTGYQAGEVVKLTSLTGLVGIPEQTSEGIRFKTLLNPKLQPGGLAQIDNASINHTIAASGSKLPAGQLKYNQYTAIEYLADVSADGIYRMYVVEHSGDTRGQGWYSEVIGLTLDPSTKEVKAYG